MRWQLQSLSLYAGLLRLSIRITLAFIIVTITIIGLWWLETSLPDWDTDWRTWSNPPAETSPRLELAGFRGAAPTWPI